MRQSLRFQILVPITTVILLLVVVLTWKFVLAIANERRQRIEERIESVANVFADANFPITQRVLEQIHGLTGALLVVNDAQGNVVAVTDTRLNSTDLPKTTPTSDGFKLASTVRVADEEFFHAAIPIRARETRPPQNLHILYSKNEYQQQIHAAIWPAIATGMIGGLVVAGFAAWLAARISGSMKRVGNQVDRIAGGDFQQMPLPSTNDELRDLAASVNQMAEKLQAYRDRIRQTEQVHTLGLLGGGLAHQLRNTVTGARMALDFHRDACSDKDDESLLVATRQLELMERYLKKFLAIARPSEPKMEYVDLGHLAENLLPLVAPAARHAKVDLKFEADDRPIMIRVDPEGLEQMILNLLLNAIEAVQLARSAEPQVMLRLCSRQEGEMLTLSVIDNGLGPDPAIADKIFEPLTSGKTDGVGLGLSIVRNVVAAHQGTVQWRRVDQLTLFEVRLPQ